MTHSSITEDRLMNIVITKGLIHLSLGLEDADDIIAELEQSLNSIQNLYSQTSRNLLFPLSSQKIPEIPGTLEFSLYFQ